MHLPILMNDSPEEQDKESTAESAGRCCVSCSYVTCTILVIIFGIIEIAYFVITTDILITIIIAVVCAIIIIPIVLWSIHKKRRLQRTEQKLPTKRKRKTTPTNCSACGKRLGAKDEFCGNCGAIRDVD